jgi:PAS domain S-box-containing protein
VTLTSLPDTTAQPARPESARFDEPTDQLLGQLSSASAETVLAGGTPTKQYRHFLDALGVAVYTADRDGRITYFNDAATALWGRRPDPGENWCGSWRLYHSDGAPMAHRECPMAVALLEQRSVRGVEAIAERPDGTRVTFMPYPSPLYDDSGRLIGAVNVMIDTTERRRAEDALRATAEALSASSTVKDEFLGLVSHELRTPVTTIFGNARLLRDRAHRLPEETRASMVSDIAGESERLLAIVENLLLMTRLGSGGEAELEPQVVNHVVRKQAAAYRARHRQRRVVVRTQTDPLVVDADRAYLEVLLENLISNADKYSPPDKPIEISVRERDGFADVVVRDRGIGIDETEAAMLFTPFYRGATARSMGNGVGIGLTVCQRLAEALGGRMWARGRKSGGSEFGFALPLAADR